jgi:hypothetical protein
VHEGELSAPAIGVGELALFEESNAAIEFERKHHQERNRHVIQQ